MKRLWSTALVGLVLPLLTGVVAEAAPSTFCFPGNGGTAVVTSPAVNPNEILPAALSDGYNNNTCALTIRTSIFPSDSGTTFTARSITVQGPSVVPNPPIPAPGQTSTNVLIVNTNAASNVTLQGTEFVIIDQGSIKATSNVRIVCTAANCPVTVTASELIATSTANQAVNGGFGGPNGTLQLTANGDLSVTGTTFTGGALVKFTSQNGDITALCFGGSGGCKDPTVPPFTSQTIKDKCGDPPVFPCNLGVLSQAQVKNICIPDQPTLCDGGSKEKDFIAEGEINFENSALTADRHLVIKTDKGPIKAAGFDLQNANLDVGGPLSIFVKGGCPAGPAISIDLTGATLKGSAGPLPIPGVAVSACNGSGIIAGP